MLGIANPFSKEVWVSGLNQHIANVPNRKVPEVRILLLPPRISNPTYSLVFKLLLDLVMLAKSFLCVVAINIYYHCMDSR